MKMIWLYSGKVGSGKSFDSVLDIVLKLQSGGYVISNFPLNFNCSIGKKLPKDHYIYMEDDKWATPYNVMKQAIKIRLSGNKKTILLVIDEAGDIFNTRDWQEKSTEHNRKLWNTFFQQHRKMPLNFNIILVSQSREYLDKQIRALINYEHRHRKINEYKFFKLIPFPLFVVVKGWCEGKSPRMGADWKIFKPWIARLYNTNRLFGHVADLIKGIQDEVIAEEMEKTNPMNKYRMMVGYATWEGYA